MNCDERRELSALFTTGELDAAKRASFDSHVAGCAECAGCMADQAGVDARIRTVLREEETDSTHLERRVRQAISSERSRRLRQRLAWAGAVAAVLVAALVIGIAPRKPAPVARIFLDAARDHRLEVMDGQPRRWHSEMPEIEALAARFGLNEGKAAALAPAGYHLIHAKTCGLEGQPVLHLVYTDGVREVSVYLRRGGKPTDVTAAEIGNEQLASLQTNAYTAVVVTAGTQTDCKAILRHAVALL